MDLFIVESNAKAKTIQKYLSGEAVVGACMGHVQDLPTSGKDGKKAMWAFSEGQLPSPPWEWTPRAERIVSSLRKLGKKNKVKRIVLATDPDREGEFIAWRLQELLGDLAPVVRIRFQEITKKAIKESMVGSNQVNENLVDAAKVRRLMDRLIGYRASRFSQSWGLKSMGRVQTPTLGFVIDREALIKAFVPIPYWSCQVNAEGIDFQIRFHEKKDEDAWRDGKGKLNLYRTSNEALAQAGYTFIKEKRSLELTHVKETKSTRKAPFPFTTDALLQAAGSRFKWRPVTTMKVAQSLYEAGHITYMRTDSNRTSPDSRAVMRQTISQKWGDEFLSEDAGEKLPKKGGAKANVQDAHEAIRPTRPENFPSLADRELKLYQLIWAQFAASQMSQAKWARKSLTARIEGYERPLDGSTSWCLHPGWEAAFEVFNGPAAARPVVSGLEVGKVLKVTESEDNPRFIADETKPPGRYTQHGLVAQMKKAGIGRPSTYAATIQKLFDRNYCRDENGTVFPTEPGEQLWITVVPYFIDAGSKGLFSSEFTASMESRLDAIESGEKQAAPSWSDFVEFFRNLHEQAREKRSMHPTPRQLAYFERLRENLAADLIKAALGEKDPEKMTTEEMKGVLNQLTEHVTEKTLPPTEKQIGYIKSMAEKLSLSEKDACALVDVASFDDLGGGRGGSASNLIGILKEKSSELPFPASEKQLKLIKRLVEQAQLSEEAATALVGAEGYDALTGGRKGTASRLIGELKTKVPAKKKSKKKADKSN